MCGIAGYFGKETIPKKKIESTLESIKHRGPDNQDYYKFIDHNTKNVYLLHTRLAILDLDKRSNQPYKIGNNALILNGEIYNYKEIKLELEKLGYKFFTSGDTEVLAKALIEWGIECLSKLEGMWAFCWYEEDTKKLILSRDRFGEKPLYYYESNGNLFFGSEPKCIFNLLGKKLNLNYQQISRYLINGYKSLYKGKDTFFDGLKEVPAGSYRIYTNNSIKEGRYWEPQFNKQDQDLTYTDSVELVRDSLIKSIQLRLRSDVPVAFFLSGGVDSNALISLAHKELGYKVHGFTVMNTDKRYEEMDLVNETVNKLGINHTYIDIYKKNFLGNLKLLIKAHDAPIYTINYFAQWKLMKEIKARGYKVTISGIGADEIFSGYYDHHLAYLSEMFDNNKFRYKIALNEWKNNISPIVRNPFLKDPNYFINNKNAREHIFLDSHFFSSLMIKNYKEDFYENNYCKDLLRNRMANELLHEAVPVLLHEDDLNAMYYSIENRSPFLDSNLFDICQRIPTIHLIKNGMAKSVLRASVKNIAPEKIISSKRKVGFNIPINNFLDLNSNEILTELLSESPIFELINKTKIEKILRSNGTSNSKSKFIFNFINARIFCEEYS